MPSEKSKNRINLQERLDNVAAKNAEVAKVKSLQEENYKLKQQMGQRKQGTRLVRHDKTVPIRRASVCHDP